jgi:hypothetical protein
MYGSDVPVLIFIEKTSTNSTKNGDASREILKNITAYPVFSLYSSELYHTK